MSEGHHKPFGVEGWTCDSNQKSFGVEGCSCQVGKKVDILYKVTTSLLVWMGGAATGTKKSFRVKCVVVICCLFFF